MTKQHSVFFENIESTNGNNMLVIDEIFGIIIDYVNII